MQRTLILIIIASIAFSSKNIADFGNSNVDGAQCLHEVLSTFLGHIDERKTEFRNDSALIRDVCPKLEYSCCTENDVRFLLNQFQQGKRELGELLELNQRIIDTFKSLDVKKTKEFIVANRRENIDKCIGEDSGYLDLLSNINFNEKSTVKYLNDALNSINSYYGSFICEICNAGIFDYFDEPRNPASIRFKKSNYAVAFKGFEHLLDYQKSIYPIYQVAKIGICLHNPGYMPHEIELFSRREIEKQKGEYTNCLQAISTVLPYKCFPLVSSWKQYNNNTSTIQYFTFLERMIEGLNVLLNQSIEIYRQRPKLFTKNKTIKGILEFYERNERSSFNFDNIITEIVDDEGWDIINNQMNPKYWKGAIKASLVPILMISLLA